MTWKPIPSTTIMRTLWLMSTLVEATEPKRPSRKRRRAVKRKAKATKQ
jgi:hypothetical protein